jgi:hypothetical protein
MRMQSTDIPFRPGSSPLLHEITDRVCNEYASVISSISRAAIRVTGEEAKLALAEAPHRLYEHASVHRALQMPMGETPETSSFLRNLCRALCRARLLGNGISLNLIEEHPAEPPGRHVGWRELGASTTSPSQGVRIALAATSVGPPISSMLFAHAFTGSFS